MKYNSIGEQLIAKAKELDPNYKPDKFNDMSEAIDILLNNSGSGSSGSSEGGDIWLDIMPYLNEDMTSISQEGYDLVSNAFLPTEETDNSNNKYAGILFMGYKMFFNELAIFESDKIGLNFIANLTDNGIKGSIGVSIYNDKSVEMLELPSSNKVWYEISSISDSKITQDEYNELTNLINNDKLSGIRVRNGYYTLFTVIDGNYMFIGYNTSIGFNWAYILSDLSTKESYTTLVKFDENPTSQVIPSFSPIHSGQQNLTIGNGLTVENGALKTTIPTLPSDANTKTYTLQAVNGRLIWTDVIGNINTILDNVNGEVI